MLQAAHIASVRQFRFRIKWKKKEGKGIRSTRSCFLTNSNDTRSTMYPQLLVQIRNSRSIPKLMLQEHSFFDHLAQPLCIEANLTSLHYEGPGWYFLRPSTRWLSRLSLLRPKGFTVPNFTRSNSYGLVAWVSGQGVGLANVAALCAKPSKRGAWVAYWASKHLIEKRCKRYHDIIINRPSQTNYKFKSTRT